MLETKILSLPRSKFSTEVLLDGGVTDTNDGTKLTFTGTNVYYGNTSVGYQKQHGVFIATSELTTASSISGVVGMAFRIYPTANNKTVFRYATGVTVSIDASNVLTTAGLTNVSIFVDNASSSTVTLNAWNDVIIHHDSVTANSYSFGVTSYTGNVSAVRTLNATLTEQERLALYLEGKRKLGNEGYPALMSKMAAQFETDGGTALYDIINGTVATYLGGSATTDDFGIAKAVTNPNYSWSSVTYADAYSWENSGSGWNLAKNPTGVSATGINRTTTFRTLFLSSSTLSSDEETALASMCASSYPYAFTKSLPSNLRDGLVLDLQNGYDQSGNGNHGTDVNSPTLIRKMTTTGRRYNGSTQYTSIADASSLDFGTGDFTIACWAKFNSLGSAMNLFSKMNEYYNGGTIATGLNFGITDVGSLTYSFSLSTWEGNSNTYIEGIAGNYYGYSAGRIALFSVHRKGTTLEFRINGRLAFSGTGTVKNVNTSFPANVGRYNWVYDQHLNGEVLRTLAWNRYASPVEIQSLFHSTYLPS